MAKLKVHIPYSLKTELRANHIPGVCNTEEALSAAPSCISHPRLHIWVILRSTVTLPTAPNPGEGSDTGYKSRQTVLPVNGWGKWLCGRWCQARREKEQPGRKLPNTHSHCRNTLWLSWGWGEEQAATSSFQAVLFASLLSGQPAVQPAVRAMQVGGTALPTWELTTAPQGHLTAWAKWILPLAISTVTPFLIKKKKKKVRKNERKPGQKIDHKKKAKPNTKYVKYKEGMEKTLLLTNNVEKIHKMPSSHLLGPSLKSWVPAYSVEMVKIYFF